ncbi:MAG TPA: DUF6036 family nucleotidyltransferase [Nitrospira sp.]|jgi:hypothetical protein|nr:DUF6036 family nucleotidyltransferase [Nitrospira sp.]HWV44487.1 DUF6036 family nucleotidyltransferase [Nitrospira sp.]
MTHPPERESLENFLRTILDALPTPPPIYCLVGALALGAWGRIRSTKDIDLLMVAEELQRARLMACLREKGFHIDQNWLDHNPFAADRVNRLFHTSFHDIPLDVIFVADRHEEETLRRRRPFMIVGLQTWVCGPEDLILMKLKASRGHDFEDAISIMLNPNLQLDFDYLWSWAERLGLQSELHYVLISADPK